MAMTARRAATPQAPLQPQAEPQQQPTTSVRVATGEEAGVNSGAIELQRFLSAEFEYAEPKGRWPLAITLPAMVAASGLLWWGIISALMFLHI
jgi:hypothetical protein